VRDHPGHARDAIAPGRLSIAHGCPRP
jgi:hypothetical protein